MRKNILSNSVTLTFLLSFLISGCSSNTPNVANPASITTQASTNAKVSTGGGLPVPVAVTKDAVTSDIQTTNKAAVTTDKKVVVNTQVKEEPAKTNIITSVKTTAEYKAMVSNPSTMTQLANDSAALQEAVKSPEVVKEIIKSPEAIKEVAKDQVAVKEIISNPESVQQILNNPEAIKQIAKNPELAAQFAQNPEIASEAMKNPEIMAAILANTKTSTN